MPSNKECISRFVKCKVDFYDSRQQVFRYSYIIMAEIAHNDLAEKMKHIVGWGTGNYFLNTVDPSEYGILDFIIENDKRKWGTTVGGIPVCSPDKLDELEPETTLIFIFSSFYDEISRSIASRGYRHYCRGIAWPQMQMKRIESKINTIRESGESDPSLAERYHDLANCHRRAGLPWKVPELLEQAISLDRRRTEWINELAQAYEYMRDHAQAAAAYEQAILATGDAPPPDWHYRRGLCLQATGDMRAANAEYAGALKNGNPFKATPVAIASLHYRHKHYGHAAAIFNSPQAPLPHTANRFYFEGKVHERCMDWLRAQDAYRQAVYLAPEKATWWMRLGCVCEHLENWQEAASCYTKAMDINRRSNRWRCYRMGYTLMLQGAYEDACRYYAQAAPPPTPPTQGDAQQATRGEIEHRLDHDARDASLWYDLGMLCMITADWQAAVAAFQHAVRRDETKAATGYAQLGMALMHSGDAKGASNAFSQMRRFPKASLIPERGKFDSSTIYTAYCHTLPIEAKTIVYEHSAGCSMGGMPFSSFCTLINKPDYNDWLHVWIINDKTSIPQRFWPARNVIFVKRETPLYCRYLASAKFLVSNGSFPVFFARRPEQRYLYTEDAICVRPDSAAGRLGSPEGNNQTRNLRHATYLITLNELTDEELTEGSPACWRKIKAFLNEDLTAVAPIRADEKPALLLYLGSFMNNGITTAGICLANHLSSATYALAIAIDPNAITVDDDHIANFNQLPDSAQVLARVGSMPLLPDEKWVIDQINTRSELFSEAQWNLYAAAYAREFHRLFGHQTFDSIVDYSGYSLYWASLFVFAPAGNKRRIIYLQNDMISESRMKYPYLRSIFQLYRHFDRLVSVTESGCARHRDALGEAYGVPDCKFTICHYPINGERIRALANADDIGLTPTAAGTARPIIFMTAGRLSPEKGHKKLIRAFAAVHRKYIASTLLILGEGPVKTELQALIKELALENSIRLVGHISNPFPYLKKADCFVLSSDHEGQPLILLEAMTLGTAIVATDIVGVHSLLTENQYGLLVENSESGLSQGMIEFIENAKGKGHFSPDAHTRTAMRMFLENALPDAAKP